MSALSDPIRAVDKPLLMPIENVFTIAGRGTVVTGKIEQGRVRAGHLDLKVSPRKTCSLRHVGAVEWSGKIYHLEQRSVLNLVGGNPP